MASSSKVAVGQRLNTPHRIPPFVAAKRLQKTLSSQCLVCLFRAAVETCKDRDRISKFSGNGNMIPSFR